MRSPDEAHERNVRPPWLPSTDAAAVRRLLAKRGSRSDLRRIRSMFRHDLCGDWATWRPDDTIAETTRWRFRRDGSGKWLRRASDGLVVLEVELQWRPAATHVIAVRLSPSAALDLNSGSDPSGWSVLPYEFQRVADIHGEGEIVLQSVGSDRFFLDETPLRLMDRFTKYYPPWRNYDLTVAADIRNGRAR